MRFIAKKHLAIGALVGALALGACDSPVGDEDHGDDVEGIQLVVNGVVVASWDLDSRTWTDGLEVGRGETALFTVRTVAHDGDVVDVTDDFWLRVRVASESTAEWEQALPGEFGGVLRGVAVGETTAEFDLMHGAVGEGHPDVTTTPVDITVTEIVVG